MQLLELQSSLESLDSSLLEVLREDYQKPLNKKRVAQIVASFDEKIANEPKVSYSFTDAMLPIVTDPERPEDTLCYVGYSGIGYYCSER